MNKCELVALKMASSLLGGTQGNLNSEEALRSGLAETRLLSGLRTIFKGRQLTEHMASFGYVNTSGNTEDSKFAFINQYGLIVTIHPEGSGNYCATISRLSDKQTLSGAFGDTVTEALVNLIGNFLRHVDYAANDVVKGVATDHMYSVVADNKEMMAILKG